MMRGIIFAALLWLAAASGALAQGGPAGGSSPGIDQFAANLRTCNSQVCRFGIMDDSEWMCDLLGSCAYGPEHRANLFPRALRQFLIDQGYPIYSSGQVRYVYLTSTVDLAPEITLTSGTVTQSSTIGPAQTGTLAGGSLLTASSGAVITVNLGTSGPGSTWNRIVIYCATNPSGNGWTVTVGGVSQGNVCTTVTGSITATSATITNPNGTTAATITLTATGAASAIYGHELIYTTGNVGVAIDDLGVGGAICQWLGNSSANFVWANLRTGQDILWAAECGVNDAAQSVATATTTAALGVIANYASARGASFMINLQPQWTGTGSTNYAATVAAEQAWATANGYDVINLQDFYPISPALAYAQGLFNSDTTHPSDGGALVNSAQLINHLFGRYPLFAQSFGSQLTGQTNSQVLAAYQSGYAFFSNPTDTNTSFNGVICSAASLATCNWWRQATWPAATYSSTAFQGTVGAATTMPQGGVCPTGSIFFGYGGNSAWIPATFPVCIDLTSNAGVIYETASRPVLTTAYSNSTTTASSITGWSWNMLANQTLVIECDGMYQAASTGGLRFQATGPTMTNFQLSLAMGLNSTAASMASPPSVTALSTLTSAIAVTTATTNYPFHLHVYAQASAAGTLQLQAASAVAVALTIGVGSVCHVM